MVCVAPAGAPFYSDPYRGFFGLHRYHFLAIFGTGMFVGQWMGARSAERDFACGSRAGQYPAGAARAGGGIADVTALAEAALTPGYFPSPLRTGSKKAWEIH